MKYSSQKTAISKRFASASKPASGFTLLEVMCALAVLALGVVPIMVNLTQGERDVHASVAERTVTLLARAKLTELISGEEDRGWGSFRREGHKEIRWEREYVEEEIAAPGDERGEPIATLKRLTLLVTYPFRESEKTLTLVTYLPPPTELEEPPDDSSAP